MDTHIEEIVFDDVVDVRSHEDEVNATESQLSDAEEDVY